MPKVKEITSEDLARWRMAHVNKELADNVFPGMSVDEARQALLHYYKLLGDLLYQYDLNADEGAIYLSPVDGGFYRLTNTIE